MVVLFYRARTGTPHSIIDQYFFFRWNTTQVTISMMSFIGVAFSAYGMQGPSFLAISLIYIGRVMSAKETISLEEAQELDKIRIKEERWMKDVLTAALEKRKTDEADNSRVQDDSKV